MTIKMPVKTYLDFSELQTRWRCTENDLRYAIISGALKPSVNIDAELDTPEWKFSALYGALAIRRSEDFGASRRKPHWRGWHYLQNPIQTGPFECHFNVITDDRDPDKPDDEEDISFSIWLCLLTPMTLKDVKSDAVFLLTEIANYEAKHGVEAKTDKEDSALKTRERDTLLTIIAALAKEAKINIEAFGKAALSIEDLTDRLGAHVSKRAIEEHLKKIPGAMETRMK